MSLVAFLNELQRNSHCRSTQSDPKHICDSVRYMYSSLHRADKVRRTKPIPIYCVGQKTHDSFTLKGSCFSSKAECPAAVVTIFVPHEVSSTAEWFRHMFKRYHQAEYKLVSSKCKVPKIGAAPCLHLLVLSRSRPRCR